MRKNGFERPFSVFQVLSWIVAAFIGISFVIITIALVLSSEDYGGSGHDAVCILLAIAYAISFIGMIYFTYLVTASDPTDPTVALERLARTALQNNMAKVDFNPNDYQFHCDVCDTHVLKNTKHC